MQNTSEGLGQGATVNSIGGVNDQIKKGCRGRMWKNSLACLTAAVGGLGLALTAGTGTSIADPIADSTCSYSQFVAALNAQDPLAGAAFSVSPETQSSLRQFLAAPPDQRVIMAEQIRTQPAAQPYLGTIERTFSVCNNY